MEFVFNLLEGLKEDIDVVLNLDCFGLYLMTRTGFMQGSF